MVGISKEKLQILDSFLADKLSKKDLQQFKKILSAKEIEIPVSLFKNKLSSLELITRYLKEKKNLSFKEIAKLLDRKYSTLSSTFYNSKSKLKHLKISDSKYFIPLTVLKKSKLSTLEAVVMHLSEHRLSTKAISKLLGRSVNTVKTVKRRIKNKS